MTLPVYHHADQKTVDSVGGAGITVAKPDNLASGDLLIFLATQQDLESLNDDEITLPSGFTKITNARRPDYTGNRPYAIAAYKVAGGSEPATYSFDTNTSRVCAVMGRVTGFDDASPVDVFGSSWENFVASLDIPSITTTGADRLLISFGNVRSNTADALAGISISGVTERWKVGAGNTSVNIGGVEDRATAGGTGVRTLASTFANYPMSGISFAISPASAVSLTVSAEPLYYGATLLANKTGIEYTVRSGHEDLNGALLQSGINATTNASGAIQLPTLSEGTAADPVTLSLYWEEGSAPVVDRSLIVKATLVAA